MAHIDSIVQLIRFGFAEDEVLNMPVDRFSLYCNAVGRIRAGERRDEISDMVSAIAGALTGKKIKEHIAKFDKIADGKVT
jgi:hypothetical protein